MTFTITPNFEPLSDGESIWKLKELLVAAGWSVRSSGSGTGGAFNGAGDVHSPGVAYGGTLDLATSWFVLRAPASMTPRREILMFRPNTSHGVWRIWYSSDGVGFTGGAPNATTPPTAADAPVTVGTTGGVANSPTGTTNIFGSAITARQYRCDYVIGDINEQFSFVMQCRKVGYNASYFIFGLDVLQNVNASDTDGAVIFWAGALGSDSDGGIARETNGIYSSTDSQTASCCHGWYVKGGGSQAWVNFPFGAVGFPNGSSQWTPMGDAWPPSLDSLGRMPSMPHTYSRGGSALATQKGWKGRSRLFKYEMYRLGCRPYGDKSRWIMGTFSIPWDGTTDMAV